MYKFRKIKFDIKKLYRSLVSILLVLMLCPVTVFAEDADPLAAINNLSAFVFSAIKAVGVIILGWGVVQIGLGVQGHDATQKSNGFLSFFGGLIIAFAKEILDLIL